MLYVIVTLQLTVAGTLLVAGVTKVHHRTETRAMVSAVAARLRLRSPAIVRVASWALPIAEVAVGAAVLVPGRVGEIGLIGAGLLLLAFTGGSVVSAAGAARLTCACFGRRAGTLGWPHVARNSVLLGMTVAVLVAPPTSAVTPSGVAVSILAALALIAVVTSIDAIVDLVLPASPMPKT